ncbi:hypothetical protein [Micromonospora sp. KC213]|uniref:hypothetical protein n=1 Tax=Micromonospora sp. KC213 TaxID=2530378 RepID=UPI001048F493|nr:hypothetical protein [Micromonospora sp. KC213]TDC41409.1 hypothetical protein E1166_11845 [Micromonospora sp. KC213]
MTSIETETLKRAGQTFQDDAAMAAEKLVAKLETMSMPQEAFPVFAWNLTGDYETLRQGALDVSRALFQSLDAIGQALSNIASHYEQQEQVRTDNFTYPN